MHSRSVFLCMTGHYNYHYVCMYVCKLGQTDLVFGM